MPNPLGNALVPTLAKLVGVEPGHGVEWLNVRPFRPRPVDVLPIRDFYIAVCGHDGYGN